MGNNICEHPSAHKSDSPESIVSDDCIHDPVMVFDLLSKFSGLIGCDRRYGLGFDPLGESIDGHEQMVKVS